MFINRLVHGMYNYTKEIIWAGKNVHVEQTSPYKIPWDTQNGPRPTDYFNSIETELSIALDTDHLLKIIIKGKGREETISVFLDDRHLELSSHQSILSMNSTFAVPDMYNIIEFIKKSYNIAENDFVVPYLEVFNNAAAQARAQEDFVRIVEPYIETIKQSDKSGTVILPIVSRSNVGDHGHHWYLCTLTLDEDKHPSVTIIDTINKSKKQLLSDIREHYDAQVLVGINKTLAAQHLSPVLIEDVKYAEILQYGNAGCGIASSLSLEDLVSKNFKATYLSDADFKIVNKHVLYVVGREDGITLTEEQYSTLVETGDINEALGTTGLEYSSLREERQSILNPEIVPSRITYEYEALRRVQLALALDTQKNQTIALIPE